MKQSLKKIVNLVLMVILPVLSPIAMLWYILVGLYNLIVGKDKDNK